MKSLRYIVCLALSALSIGAYAVQEQDFIRLSERDLVGTARYVGMCGAMTAIGGDPSAVRDNPAGLGLYRRMEILFSVDYNHDITTHPYEKKDSPQKTNHVSVSQASIVIALGDADKVSGLIFNNIMLSYHRIRTYDRKWKAVGNSGNLGSMGALIAQTGVDLGIAYPAYDRNSYNDFYLAESGHVNEFSFDWAANFSNKWYIGTGLHLQSYTLNDDAEYYEEFPIQPGDSLHPWLQNNSAVLHSGVGCKMTVGVIYRPTRWWRLGLSLETPTLGSLRTYTSGTIKAFTDSTRYSNAPELTNRVKGFHMPLRLSGSVALQVYDKAMIALQYDYTHTFGKMDFHTLRAGVEVVPVNGLYLNAGYSALLQYDYTNPNPSINGPTRYAMDPTLDRQDTYFRTPMGGQYASFGIGYRGAKMMVQAAYQYHWQAVDLCPHENQWNNMRTDTHRVVVTIGWHHSY